MIDTQSVIGEIRRLRVETQQPVQLETLLLDLWAHHGRPMLEIHSAVMCALLAGKIELRPARLVTGEDTNTYMVFVRE